MPADDHNAQPAPRRMVIGWREPASLPQWGIGQIKTKIDTGARTSALHVDNLQHLPDGRVRFDVIVEVDPDTHQPRSVVPVECAVLRQSRVRNSGGCNPPRPVVRTRLRLGPVERDVEISLVSRHGMLCRLLVGRTALKGTFLVDPSRRRRLSAQRAVDHSRSTRS